MSAFQVWLRLRSRAREYRRAEQVAAAMRNSPGPSSPRRGLRGLWPISIPCRSDAWFAFGVATLWAALHNLTFWQHTAQAMWRPSASAIVFFASLTALVVLVQALLLLLMPTRWLMRAAASVFSVIAALSSYFVQEYGAIMNKDMMRNVFGTDSAEVGALLNLDLLVYVVLLGLLPAWLVWRVALPPRSFLGQWRQRLIATAVALAVAGASVLASSAQYAVYLRAHKSIRYELSPAAPVVSAAQVLLRMSGDHGVPRFVDLGQVGTPAGAPHAKPTVLFIVVGESARAANFQLGGYGRETTPALATLSDVVYFSNVSACGTSTAVSVPCMFSPLGRRQFDVEKSPHVSNVFDSLSDAGWSVEWRENNAGCKGVCDRVKTIRYDARTGGPDCEHSYCYDEVMLTGLADQVRALTTDTVIVFHLIGSHGPAYWERYPATLERFRPSCRSNELHTCSAQELINTYDNTIAYTDRVVSRQIEILQAASDVADGFLLYVSDHGESLGEKGVYLHGMPYALAPHAQTRVPLLIWASAGYLARRRIDVQCLGRQAAAPLSHDSVYHTILGAAEVRDAVYRAEFDLLGSC